MAPGPGPNAWRWVRPLLRDAGHDVFTPALTGLGERAHLAQQTTDLDTHIQDVVAVLHYEDLRDVVLVGHSYGGMVITGVADRAGDRISHLVYFDAEVPLDGQSELDLVSDEERTQYERSAQSNGDGWRIPPPFPDPLPEDTDPIIAWAVSRMAPQPLATFNQPLRLTGSSSRQLAHTYLLCLEGKQEQELPFYVKRVQADPAWRVVELNASHIAHVSAPKDLVALLVDLANH